VAGLPPSASENNAAAPGGPLAGLRVLEFVSIGPGPHAAMMLSDQGAEVVRIDRAGGNGWPNPIMDRGRAALEVDIRSEAGRDLCLAAADKADVIIEGFRPGVMERLGLGPEVLLQRNPRLVYGRITGWGQTGPLARTAGHDINYIALTGALAAMGGKDGPSVPPLNLVGDFGGGSLYLLFGIMAALYERERSGKGQVVDAAIVDGVASMMTMFTGLLPAGLISLDRRENVLGGAAPFYRCYTCADGLDIAIGPLEPQFYADFIKRIGAPEALFADQYELKNWEERTALLAELFATKCRADWCAILEGTDTCFAPVLTADEAPHHPHLQARGSYIERDGLMQAAPAPRFSRTPGSIAEDTDGRRRLKAWGVDLA
jgi:alpha-methylacyl-CoA racemase